jgi:hypothetical protein
MSPAPRNRPNPSTKDAKLIAFKVGEYHPRRVTLPDIGPPSTAGKETFDFCGLIDRTEVRMESVLACLLLWNRHEQQARHPIRSRPDLELVRGVGHDNPAQGLGPPSTKRDRIVSVDDDLLPNEIHVAHSARSGLASGPFSEPTRDISVAFRQAAITDRSVGSTLRETDIDYFTGEDHWWRGVLLACCGAGRHRCR